MAMNEYFEAKRDEHLAQWFDFLRIPSVSALSRHRADMQAAAQWLVGHMQRIGLQGVRVVETAGHPLVVGERIEDPKAPTALVYGHYDVQPVDPEHLWHTPPFEPQVREGKVYARGASDDKGQVFMHLKAVEALLATEGRLPVNVRFLIEGEEEIGSPNLADFVANHQRPDVVVISDTSMPAADLPGICYGLRGITALEVEVQGAARDMHSGLFGGTVPNALHVLAELVAGLHDASGRVTVPGFYDSVRPIDDTERRRLAAQPFDQAAFTADLGVKGLFGEPEYTPIERLGVRPTLELNGMWGGFQGEGTKTVIPAVAHAKITCRLVPDQDPQEIAAMVQAELERRCPPWASVRVTPGHSGKPWICTPDHPAIQAGLAAMEAAFGTEAILMRAGGSIPVVETFDAHWRVPIVLMGFALPTDSVHAPNEHFHLTNFDRGLRALTGYWQNLSAALAD